MLAASVYGMGFDRAKELTRRVEPLFPLFAAAMNLVLIADDAYAFLFSWELMSLASWALVVARHTDPESRRAGHLYLVMAAIGTVALLFAFGGLAGPAGGYAFDTIRAHPPGPTFAALVLAAALVGCGSKGGLVPLACLAAARPSGGAEPRLGADERRHDQGGDLWLRAHRLRSAGAARLVVGAAAHHPGRADGRARACSMPCSTAISSACSPIRRSRMSA